MRQGRKLPFGVSALATIDGTNNFKDSYSPALGAIVSWAYAQHVAIYVEPIWVNNTNPLPKEVVDHNDTFMVGIGARVRIRPTVYLVGEAAPRATGYKPGVNHGSFAIEKHVGGEKADKLIIAIAVVLGVALSIGLFILLPTFLAGLLDSVIKYAILRNLAEGVLRILIFLCYLWLATKAKDIQRVWAYHGAEHMQRFFCTGKHGKPTLP
jgi:hypothetical protein